MLVRDVMSFPAITVHTDTSIAEASALLLHVNVTGVPVLDADEKLVGIVTEADLLYDRIAPDPRRRRRERTTHLRVADTVGEVMTSPVESLTPGADIADAASIMIDERIRCLPVVDGHRIIGVVSRRDLLRAITPEPDPLSAAHRPRYTSFDPDCP